MTRRVGMVVLWLCLGCHEGGTVTCENPRPLQYVSGESTGFVRCADGTTHRVEALLVPPPAAAPDCRGEGYFLDCAADSDCQEGPNGHCGQYDPGCTCSYHCLRDSDCGQGQACIASVVTGEIDYATCHAAKCLSASDCLSAECGIEENHAGGECDRSYGLQCRSVGDECRVDSDCTEDAGSCRIGGATDARSFTCVDDDAACPAGG